MGFGFSVQGCLCRVWAQLFGITPQSPSPQLNLWPVLGIMPRSNKEYENIVSGSIGLCIWALYRDCMGMRLGLT